MVLAVFGALVLLGESAAARQIIFPPDRAVLEEAEVEVVGIRSEEPSVLAWGAEGAREEVPLESGYFAHSITLQPGVNSITVGAEGVSVFLPGDGAGSPPAGFSAPDLHAVDNSCDDCHVETGSEDLQAEGAELCANCHDDVSAGDDGEAHEVQHPPVDDGECTSCHVFHGPAMSGLSGNEVAGLCFECHDDFSEEEGAVLHPVLEDDGCLDCHRPHGSAHGAILVVASEELCFECHDNPALNGDGEEWSTPHPAVDDGCTACHSPHASQHGTLLLAEAAALCGECHDDKNVDDDGNAWDVPHSPVDEGECTGCHLPHGSEEGSLLAVAVPELCSECHDDKNTADDGDEWPTPHPPVQDGECLSCHVPHGSATAAMLTAAVPELCNECHDDKRLADDGEAWMIEHPPVARGRCMECHAPHGGVATGLLASHAIETCSKCHEEPHYNHLFYEGETPKVAVPPTFPMRKDGSLDCTGCHLPHGSGEMSLWRGDQAHLCTICHKV